MEEMKEKEKKNKRIRYPKKKLQPEQQEEKKHFVLEVQDGVVSNKSKFGN